MSIYFGDSIPKEASKRDSGMKSIEHYFSKEQRLMHIDHFIVNKMVILKKCRIEIVQ
jgi:hypothetical protein